MLKIVKKNKNNTKKDKIKLKVIKQTKNSSKN